jgi:hypothetical protein
MFQATITILVRVTSTCSTSCEQIAEREQAATTAAARSVQATVLASPGLQSDAYCGGPACIHPPPSMAEIEARIRAVCPDAQASQCPI